MPKTTETVIEPRRSFALDWKELFSSNQLIYFFTWRNFKIRYKQTAVGAAWAIIQPIVLMIVFTLVFARVGNISSGTEGVPYPIFSFAGLLFWNYFSQTTTQVSNSLLNFQSVINKIYFPRLLAPISSAITGLVDFGFALIVYIGLMIYYKIPPTLEGIFLFGPMVLLSFITVLGLGLFLSALNVKYRDVRQILPFFIQTLLFVTPVIYPVSIVPEQMQWILFLNPMTGVIETMRASLLSTGPVPWEFLMVSVTSAFIMFIVGLVYFRSKEKEFADLI